MDSFRKFIKDHENQMLSLLSELISIPSVMSEATDTFPFGEKPAQALSVILSAASKMGFVVTNRDNYYGTVDYLPDDSSEPSLAVLCHLDVVPESKGWTYPPFSLTEKDGTLYGRGVTDDKGPAVSALFALYAIKELGVKLSKGVRLIFGTNEENGSADIEYYLKNEKMPLMVFTPDASYPVINCEKGMARMSFSAKISNCDIISIHGGQVINAVPSEAEAVIDSKYADSAKAFIADSNNGCVYSINEQGDTVHIISKGESAHASTPENGTNAITGLLQLLCSLDISDKTTAKLLSDIVALYPHGETDGSSLGVNCKDESGALTCVLSLIDAKDGKLTFSTDTRFPRSMSCDELKQKVAESIGKTNINLSDFSGTEPHYTSPDSFLAKTLLSVYEEETGIKEECLSIGGGTYVHGISGGVAFGVEHPGKDYRIHGADEFVPKNEFFDNAVMFAKAIEKICR
ncbi:MAG: Sapep family Mn(2+)-dependent dipeptidase [Ruminiclostridium sp.]